MGVGIDEIVSAIQEPDISYPSGIDHPRGRTVSVWHRIAVVHTDDPKPTVISALWHRAEGRGHSSNCE
jgi:hypothetical protein